MLDQLGNDAYCKLRRCFRFDRQADGAVNPGEFMRIDPLGLRNLLPTSWIEWLFARFAVLVRSRTGASEGTPEATVADFPVGAPDERCLDLLAICDSPLRP